MKLFSSIMLLCISITAVGQSTKNKGILIDSRDQQKYPIIKIGDNWWMAKNLNFKNKDSYCFEDK